MPQSIFRWKVVFWPKDNYSEGYFFEIKFSAHPTVLGLSTHLFVKVPLPRDS